MTCATKCTVLLAEGNEKVSAALHEVLEHEQDLELISETDSGSEVLTLTEELHPDIILLSHTILGPHLLETLGAIAGRFPLTRVLVLSSHNDSRFAIRAIEAGASGYMLKDRAFEELGDAVRTIASNRIYLSPGIAGMGRKNAVSPGSYPETGVQA